MKVVMPQQLIQFKVPPGATCVSIYANNSAELADLLDQARKSARRELSGIEVDRLFRPLNRFDFDSIGDSEDFPIGIFITRGFSAQMKLPFPVKGLAVVARSFHVKPLLKWIQREHPFTLLFLEDAQATLFQGTLSTLKEEEVLPYRDLRTMDGVFNALDRAVYRTVQTSRTPLVLAGDMDLVEHYRNVSGYKAIVEDAIIYPSAISNREELHRAAVELLEPYLERREDVLLEQYRVAERTGRAVGTLRDIIQHALQGKVRLLLVSEGMNIWGRIDPKNGSFTYSPQQLHSPEDDVLDDLAELVLRGQGTVAVIPSEKMPHGHVACAILNGAEPIFRLQPKDTSGRLYDNASIAV